MNWISVEDQLPEEGTLCWTLEKVKLFGRRIEWSRLSLSSRTRRYRSKKQDGSPAKHAWSSSGMFDRQVVYWIAIPTLPDEPQEKKI